MQEQHLRYNIEKVQKAFSVPCWAIRASAMIVSKQYCIPADSDAAELQICCPAQLLQQV